MLYLRHTSLLCEPCFPQNTVVWFPSPISALILSRVSQQQLEVAHSSAPSCTSLMSGQAGSGWSLSTSTLNRMYSYSRELQETRSSGNHLGDQACYTVANTYNFFSSTGFLCSGDRAMMTVERKHKWYLLISHVMPYNNTSALEIISGIILSSPASEESLLSHAFKQTIKLSIFFK